MKDTIKIFEEEHDHILNSLKVLEESINKEKITNNTEEALHIILEAKKHHDREEKVLFPLLEKKGFDCAPEQMRFEHKEMDKLKQQLKNAILKNDIKKLKNKGEKFVPMIREHIWKENNILYPTARNMLSKREIENMRKDFDKIGYCCFYPVDKK